MNLIDKISDVQFEELCYDLLADIGFRNLSWRKGTTANASPSDQGRDIEATYVKNDIDNSIHTEKWFIECKHYREGVPPAALQGALSWAESSTPDTLLIIASGFLSNSCKEYIREYERNRRPPFRIKIWENPDLERILFGKARLLNKYNLAPPTPHIDILHPVHKLLIKKPLLNTMEYFLSILSDLDSRKRDRWFFGAYMHIINPSIKEPTSGDQTMGELSSTPVSYHEFKVALHKARNYVGDLFLINGIVNLILTELLASGDITSVQEIIERHKSAIHYFNERTEEEPAKSKTFKGCISLSESKIATAESDLKEGYKNYCEFCESFLSKLFLEKFTQTPPALENE